MPCQLLVLLDSVSAEIRSTWDAGGRVRLPEPGAEFLKRVFIGALMVVLVFLVFAFVRSQKARRGREARERKKLEAFLERCGLTPSEKVLVREVVASSDEAMARVVKLVLSFDRAVDRYLKSFPLDSAEERLLRLRRLKTLRSKLSLDRVPPGVALVSTREISMGQAFLLRFSADDRRHVFAGTLIDSDDAGLMIRLGREEEAEVSSEAGAKLEAYFLRQNEGGYRFNTRLKALIRGNETVLQLSHPRKIIREQRRDYLRMPLREAVRFAPVSPESLEGPRAREVLASLALVYSGTVIDLSGGGFRLSTEGVLRTDDLIAVRLSFLEPPLDQELLVARVIKVHREGSEFGMAFESLSAAARGIVLRYLEQAHKARCTVGAG